MAKPVVIFLGVFAAGEIPYPLVHTFNDANSLPIDITGWTIWMEFEGPGPSTYGQGTVALDGDPTTGNGWYTWHNDDFQDVGKYEVLMWVENPAQTIRLASDLVKYEVYDGPGATPTT